IGQLWDTYNNFQGLPELSDSDTKSISSDNNNAVDVSSSSSAIPEPSSTEERSDADMDAYAVRTRVHEQLTLAQSEIQVSLDMVRLLLAAKKRAARGDTAGGGQTLAKHDQGTAPTAFAALVGGDIGTEVTIGGLPFPIGVVDTVKTERRVQAEQQANELKFVLGAKYRQMGEAADTLLMSSQRLHTMVRGESGFWRTAFALRKRNWVVHQQRQLMGAGARRIPLYGDRYFIRYGYADSGSSFSEDGIAEILRPGDEAPSSPEDDDVSMHSPDSQQPAKSEFKPAPLFIPSTDRRHLQARLLGDAQAEGAAQGDYCASLDRTHGRLLSARRALFDRELYHRLCKEARVLDLGSIRSAATESLDESLSPLIRDILVTSQSRDHMDVRLEWTLHDLSPQSSKASSSWLGEYYAGLALVMAAMYQRRLHKEVKRQFLGAHLASRAHVAANGRAPAPPPDAFVSVPVTAAPAPQTGTATPSGAAPSGSETAGSGGGSPAAAAVVAGAESAAVAAEAPGAGTTFAVARPDLLILTPVLQGLQFARWQHVLAAHAQRACAAWRQLTGEAIEVITHFARSYQTPDGAWSSLSTRRNGDDRGSEGLAYVIRMRFPGGSIMAFRVDSAGSLVFVKGYFPPSTEHPPDQISIHRVFRIIPMAGLPEFVDQLRREMQALVLLRVAAALSRRTYQRVAKRCQMGQWYVHQAQLCAVGDVWEGARHRQIIAVPCWDGDLVSAGDSDAWRLSLAFGPKHPTAFDTIPANVEDGPRVPWTTIYPPAPGSEMAQQISHLKTFEERLLQVLVSSL
ncbi:hypothetical protein FBU31_000450, partial [Coemansia sp. 'formosensis']